MDETYEDLGFHHLDALLGRRRQGLLDGPLAGVDLSLWTRIALLATAGAAAASSIAIAR